MPDGVITNEFRNKVLHTGLTGTTLDLVAYKAANGGAPDFSDRTRLTTVTVSSSVVDADPFYTVAVSTGVIGVLAGIRIVALRLEWNDSGTIRPFWLKEVDFDFTVDGDLTVEVTFKMPKTINGFTEQGTTRLLTSGYRMATQAPDVFHGVIIGAATGGVTNDGFTVGNPTHRGVPNDPTLNEIAFSPANFVFSLSTSANQRTYNRFQLLEGTTVLISSLFSSQGETDKTVPADLTAVITILAPKLSIE